MTECAGGPTLQEALCRIDAPRKTWPQQSDILGMIGVFLFLSWPLWASILFYR